MQDAPNLPPGIAQFIAMSSSFIPTPNRRAFEVRMQSQDVYKLATSHLFNTDAENREENEQTEQAHSDKSILNCQKLGFVFGGFATVNDSIQNLHGLLKRQEPDLVRSLIARSEQLLNTLIERTQTEHRITWLNFKVDLREWISVPSSFPKHNQYLSSSIIAFPFVLICQYCELLAFLYASGLKLSQLNERCTFSAGFSLGLITSYIVSICSTAEELVEYALSSIETAFWLGFRLSQKMQEMEIKRWNRLVVSAEKISIPPSTVIKSGSVQVSGVNHTEIQLFLVDFNANYGITDICPFEICVILQSNRVTIGGLRSYMTYLISSLIQKFPSVLLTEVPIDLPVHAHSYFEGVSDLVIDDLQRNQIHFDHHNTWHDSYCISSADGKLLAPNGNIINEIILAIAERVCRWDLVSLSLLEKLKTGHELEPLLLIDIGPGVRSRDLIHNFKQLLKTEHENYEYSNRLALFPLAESMDTRTAAASFLRQQGFTMASEDTHSLDDSIAIVGMACRFPQIMSVEEYFNNLLNRKNCISIIPKERWDHQQFVSNDDTDSPYKMKVQHLGLMEEIDMFDHKFFNLNVRDASHMDPQQRLTMECCYLALENAGYVMNEGYRLGMPEFRIGIFVGTSGSDNYRKNMQAHLDAYLPQCGSRSFQAGRVSYFFKFSGPSIQVDTACSASMTCLHLACQAISSKECDAAVVSGILITTDPVEYAGLAAGGFFSATGRCKPFSAEADGYIRSDGVAAIVIRPYKDAIKNHDFIHSMIRATSANQSGQAQNILLPSKPQISSLMQQCLDKAHLTPSDVQYVETHAAGTQGGDPIETNAIIEVLGKKIHRAPFKNNPLYLGSHKAFIGHSEAASGLAGIIKVSMMLQHKLITPHFDLEPNDVNPAILINNVNTNVIIPTAIQPWAVPKVGMPRCAIVNSFGFSGANACCLLQETPRLPLSIPKTSRKPPAEIIVTLSAKHPDSLRALIIRMIQYVTAALKNIDSSTNPTAHLQFLNSLSYTTTARRTHFIHRIAVIAKDLTSLIQRLFSVLKNEPYFVKLLEKSFLPDKIPEFFFETNEKHVYCSPEMAQTRGITELTEANLPKKIVFLFSGQGSQYYKMCQELINFQPSFDMTVRLCSEVFEQIHPNYFPNGLDIYSFLTHSDPASLLDDEQFRSTLFLQPLLFSIEYSLGHLFLEWGIQPDFLIGHSFGEIVAACLGNVLKLHDALFLIGHRARLMNSCPSGSMLACNTSIPKLQGIIRSLNMEEEDISIASQNSQDSIVIAGSENNIRLIEDHLENTRICRKSRLAVSHAFHSHLMGSMQKEFQLIADSVAYQPSSIPILCNVDGTLRREFDGEYWATQIISTVKFHQSIETLKQLAADGKFELIFLELSPMAILSPYIREKQLTSIFVLNKNSSDMQTIYAAIAQLYCCCGSIDVSSRLLGINWNSFHRYQLQSKLCRVLSLPSYVFNSKSLWLKLPWVCNDPEIQIMHEDVSNSLPSSYTHIYLPLIGKCEYRENRSARHYQLQFPIFDRNWKIDIQNHVVNNNQLFSIPLYISLITQFYTYVQQQDETESTHIIFEDVLFGQGFIWEETDNDSDKCRTILLELLPPKNLTSAIRKDKPLIPFKVSSIRPNSKNQPVPHATGSVGFGKDENSIDANNTQSSFTRMNQELHDTANRRNNTRYETDEFYQVSSEVNTYYGPHFHSTNLFVCDRSGLTSWTKQIINIDQPYSYEPHCRIYPSYLDSFLQSYGVQAKLIKGVKNPFVAVFVEQCIIQLDVFNQNTLANNVSFFTETTAKVNSPQRITFSTTGFNREGRRILQLNGLGMISPKTDHVVRKKEDINVSITTSKVSDVKSTVSSVKTSILSIICDSLECESHDINCEEDFASIGIDSLLSIEIRRKVENAVGLTLPYSLLFDYPTVNSLTDHLLSLTDQASPSTLEDHTYSCVDNHRNDEKDQNKNESLQSYRNENSKIPWSNRSFDRDERPTKNNETVVNNLTSSLSQRTRIDQQLDNKSKQNGYHTMQANHKTDHHPFERSAHLISMSNVTSTALASDEPIIFMHTAPGRAHIYQELAKLFEPLKRPMYGFEAFGFEDNESSEHSMTVVLRSYANAIKNIYPKGGKLTIVGYSLSGILAYVLAIKLLKFKVPEFHIKSIILIDSGAPTDKRLRFSRNELLDFILGNVLKSRSTEILKTQRKVVIGTDQIERFRSVITAYLLSIQDYFHTDIPPVYKVDCAPTNNPFDDEDPQTYFVAHGAELGYQKYVSSIIDKITLIRASDATFFLGNFDIYEESLNWNMFLQWVLNSSSENSASSSSSLVSIRIHTISANHSNILDSPQVQNLASFLIENKLV